jgi:hypothetical protein
MALGTMDLVADRMPAIAPFAVRILAARTSDPRAHEDRIGVCHCDAGGKIMKEERPSNVQRFEQLMYLSIAIGALNIALDWGRLVSVARPVGGAVFVLVVDAFVFVFLISLIWLIGRRAKNWARWVLLIFFLLGTPTAVRVVVNNLRVKPFVGALGLVQVALQVIALFLIFTGNSRAWFGRQTARA